MLDQFAVNLQDEQSDHGSEPVKVNKRQQMFSKRLDLRTLSRESRDLICLVLKAFAA